MFFLRVIAEPNQPGSGRNKGKSTENPALYVIAKSTKYTFNTCK